MAVESWKRGMMCGMEVPLSEAVRVWIWKSALCVVQRVSLGEICVYGRLEKGHGVVRRILCLTWI